MTSPRKIVPIAAAGAAALVLIVLGIVLRWPAWAVVVAVLVCGLIGAVAHLALNRPQPEPIYVPQPIPAPEPPTAQLVSVQGVTIASARPDYEFILDAAVYWRTTGDPAAPHPHFRPAARAIDTIIEQAARIAATVDPGMAGQLQHRLNDILGVVRTDSTGRVEVWADQVRISLFDADAVRLRRLADIRKDEELWQHERRRECDKRAYLTDDVLKTTGSALVWWLSHHDGDVRQAADLIGTMARLSAAAQDEDIPTLFRHLLPQDQLPPEPRFPAFGSDGAGQPFDMGFVGGLRTPVDLFTEMMNAMRLDDAQRSLLAAQLADAVAAAGNASVARDIRERFDVIVDEPEADPDVPEPDDEPTETTGLEPEPSIADPFIE